MATMLYRAGKEMLVNNDLWCDTLTVEDEAVDAALAEGWCLHYSETPVRAAEMLAEAEAKAAAAKAEVEVARAAAAEAERAEAEAENLAALEAAFEATVPVDEPDEPKRRARKAD
jgi:hypothetical protein